MLRLKFYLFFLCYLVFHFVLVELSLMCTYHAEVV
uniref:Uncharacterized protein n=1 Tax=Anguilla anguilla TaxID=7936 RepID=A0A0E9V353_ANGAN